MYIVFNYQCPACQFSEERFVERSRMDTQFCIRPHTRVQSDRGNVPASCRGARIQKMVRLPAGTRTTFLHADRKLKQ